MCVYLVLTHYYSAKQVFAAKSERDVERVQSMEAKEIAVKTSKRQKPVK